MTKLMQILIVSIFTAYLLVLSSSVIADEAECNFHQVSRRIYVISGSDHETCPKKEVEHPLTNPAIIVGEPAVIVVDRRQTWLFWGLFACMG
jgi:hypothetical protein